MTQLNTVEESMCEEYYPFRVWSNDQTMKDGVASGRFWSHGERHKKSWMGDEEKIGFGGYFRNKKK